jgi:hypothetical protein
MMTKLVQGAPLQVDLSANFLFNDKLPLGAAYRWSAALSAMDFKCLILGLLDMHMIWKPHDC